MGLCRAEAKAPQAFLILRQKMACSWHGPWY